MLENVNLKRRMPGDEYARVLPGLQRRLYDLEKTCWDNKVSSIIVFEGWDAAGKGSSISTLTQRLDPRGFKLHAMSLPRPFELNWPWLRRFWLRVPMAGEMAIFDQSWYSRVLEERVEGLVHERSWRAAYGDIADFERTLADDGTVIVKFFLHISRKEQEKRFKVLEADPLEAWRVTRADWARHKKYAEYLAAVEDMLDRTEEAHASWTIVEATSRRWARTKILRTVIAALEQRLGGLVPPRETPEEAAAADAEAATAIEPLDDGGEA